MRQITLTLCPVLALFNIYIFNSVVSPGVECTMPCYISPGSEIPR